MGPRSAPKRDQGPLPDRIFFASRTVVVVNLLVIGATRAPAFIDGILAVDKRGQMTGGSERARLINDLISEDLVSDSAGDGHHRELRVGLERHARRWWAGHRRPAC